MVVLAILLLMGSYFSVIQPAHAQSSFCSVDLAPNPLSPIDVDQTEFFQISNNLDQDVHWLKITRPSADFMINGLRTSLNGVTATTTDSTLILSSASAVLPANTFNTIQLSIDAGLNETDPVDWGVQISADQSGNSPLTCDGNLGMAAYGYYPYDTPYRISNVQVSNIKDTSVAVSWDSDVPTSSIIYYDQSADQYLHKTSLDGSLATSHSVTVSGLTASTGYHFMAAGADATGRTAYSADGTFLTAATPPPATASSGSSPTNLAGSTSSIGHKFIRNETTPPKVFLSTAIDSGHHFAEAPLIRGQASDNQSVFAVEYSTDGGKDWLAADTTSGLGTPNATFSFTPLNLLEANYQLLVRAIDTSGNISVTPAATLVIDRLPPLVGGSVLSLGSQVLQSDSSGEISTQAGVDEKITLSAVGGPTSIMLNVISSEKKIGGKTFSLTQSADTELWSGIISFIKPGSYDLVANSIDGAGNKTSKLVNKVRVAPAAKVLSQGGKPVSATVTAYYLAPDTNDWVVWDSNAYGQDNPQTTNKAGTFNLFLPAGTYYLRAAGKGFAPITTNIFRLKTASPIVAILKANRSGSLFSRLASSFSIQPIGLNTSSQDKAGSLKSSLIGSQVPDFSLTNTNGQTVNAASLLGRPTILSFMSSWVPTTSEQLPALNQLASNQNINVVPIALQQTAGEAAAYRAISGYNLTWLADPDSTTSTSFSVSSLPTHYFIDRNGTVKKIVIGVLSKPELLNDLASL